MSEIIDVILMKGPYSDNHHAYIVLDRKPDFRYERIGNDLFAQDDGFFNCYGYERPDERWKAFGGAKFDIPMKDGSVIQAYGQWWDVSPRKHAGVDIVSCGVATLESLSQCYVFQAGHVSRNKLDAWMSTNEPARDYNKYRKPVAVT